jgi:undecaprenyl-phosphate 4-deoxy-4-formamido-L-arabinose transferase
METAASVSLVIPVFNEAGNLDELIGRCLSTCRSMARPFDIILVDDGSRDGSADIISSAADAHSGEIVGILLNRNYGQHAAVMAGLERACGQTIVTLDADLQNPPEEIPRLVEQIDQGFDVVGTVRVHRRDTLFRKLASRITNRIVRTYTGVEMQDYGCMLRAYGRIVVDAILTCREHSTFIPVLANNFAGNPTEIEVGHNERTNGQSKYDFWKLINLQFDLLTCTSTLPLRILSVLGAVISGAGITFGIFLGIMRLVMGPEWAVGGVFTLFSVLFVFTGLQFIGMGLLGEYIGRIYSDVRARPRFSIRKMVGSSQLYSKRSVL